MIKMNEKLTALFIGISVVPKLQEHCMNSKNSLLKIRANQGRAGGKLIAPELMGHDAIPCKWKEFFFHRGCSFNVTSIFTSRLIAGGRESEEGRPTTFFTPLNPFGYNPDEERTHR